MRISVSKLEVEPGRMSAHVLIPDERERHVSKGMADQVLLEYPSLASHSCINSKGPTFADAIVGTSSAHLLEHLVIHFQAACDDSAPEDTFVGSSEWEDKEEGCALVQVSFRKDEVALRALRQALCVMEAL